MECLVQLEPRQLTVIHQIPKVVYLLAQVSNVQLSQHLPSLDSLDFLQNPDIANDLNQLAILGPNSLSQEQLETYFAQNDALKEIMDEQKIYLYKVNMNKVIAFKN